MVANSFSVEVPADVSLDRLWRAVICDDHNLLPKLMPEFFTGCQVQGDGGPGSIKIYRFDTPAVPDYDFIKERIDVLDHSSHTMKYTVVEGGLVGLKLKSQSKESKFEATGADSCVAKFRYDYDTIGDDEPDLPEQDVAFIKNGTVHLVKMAEGLLIANPEAYAN